MRLNIFLPYLRKAKKGVPPRTTVLSRWSRRVFPSSWLSDPISGRPGAVRRLLKRIGPTWLSSPVRRVVQGVCLLLFGWLFFYVCWPYTAGPARIWAGATPRRVDTHVGRLELNLPPDAQAAPLRSKSRLHLLDETGGNLGLFSVVDADSRGVTLDSVTPLTEEVAAALTFGTGPWSLAENAPGAWPSHYADDLVAKEFLRAEFFLVIDPLVSLSTGLASRSWVWSLSSAAVILLVCVFIPRGFCGYLCPLGTLIDLFDWAVGRRVTRLRVADDGWWVHIKYYLLAATMLAAVGGVLLSGYVAAIPIVTRAMLFLLEPLQTAALRGRHQVPSMNPGHVVSLVLFAAVLALGFFQPRFWCKYVCPSGAVFSLGNLLRVTERKVESTCINCNKCIEICPFDAIKLDFTTRTTDCTLCQTCGGVCPTEAIKFVQRWNRVELKVENDPLTGETAIGRRGFLSLAAGSAAAIAGATGAVATTRLFGARLNDAAAARPVRPPGSVPEFQFLQLCIRCGECFKACPNNVLQAVGFQQGLEGLWTPQVAADWAGCESSCNACGQVCPTGAIRALPLEEKRHARMGLAIVNPQTCLPFAEREACQLCVDACVSAGYKAIEFTRVGSELDDEGMPTGGFLAPVVLADLCVGCGLCQERCYRINVVEKGLLRSSAILIEAGEGKEDRLMAGVTAFPLNRESGFAGSYAQLRLDERAARAQEQQQRLEESGGSDSYLPDFLQ